MSVFLTVTFLDICLCVWVSECLSVNLHACLWQRTTCPAQRHTYSPLNTETVTEGKEEGRKGAGREGETTGEMKGEEVGVKQRERAREREREREGEREI